MVRQNEIVAEAATFIRGQTADENNLNLFIYLYSDKHY